MLRANAFTLEFLVEYAAGFAAEFVALPHPLHGKIVVVHEPGLFQLVKHVRNNPGIEVERDKAFLKFVAGPGPLIEQQEGTVPHLPFGVLGLVVEKITAVALVVV